MRNPAGIVLVVVLLAGCAQIGTEPSASSSPTAEPSLSTSMSPTSRATPTGSTLGCPADPCGKFVMTGSEPFIAADPADGAGAVVAAHFWAYGEHFAHPWMGVAHTADAGRTWTQSVLPGSLASGVPNGYAFAADPMVVHRGKDVVVAALAGHGTAYHCVMNGGVPAWCGSTYDVGDSGVGVLANALDVVAWVSTDDGQTFAEPRVVHGAQGAFVIGPVSPPVQPPVAGNRNLGTYNDKEFLAADAVTGRLHLAWNTIGDSGYSIAYSQSEDGLAWTQPVVLGKGFGASLAARNGTALISYRDVGTNDLLVARSLDGGQTWQPGEKVATLPGYDTAPIALYRDASALLAYPGENRTAIELLDSDDAGRTWTSIGQVLQGTSARRLPALALDDRGTGVLTSYMDAGAAGGDGAQVPWGILIRAGKWPTGEPKQLSTISVGPGTILDYMGAAAGRANVYWGAWMQEGERFGVHAGRLAITTPKVPVTHDSGSSQPSPPSS